MAAGDKARRTVEQWALQHQMIPEQLDPMADRIRDAYVKSQRTAYPHYRLNSSTHNNVFWRQVATKVIDCGADPVAYVAVAFKQCASGKCYPNMLLSAQVANALNSPFAAEREEHDIELNLTIYADKLEQRFAEGRKSLGELLTDISICGCPLFVWCVAVKYKLYDVAARYKSGADRLLTNPAYKRVYTRVFKEVFTDGGN